MAGNTCQMNKFRILCGHSKKAKVTCYFLVHPLNTAYSISLTHYIHIYMVMVVLVADLCPTLCDPMECSPPGSSVHWIFQARILEWEPFPSPGIFLTQESNLGLLPCRQILHHLRHQKSPSLSLYICVCVCVYLTTWRPAAKIVHGETCKIRPLIDNPQDNHSRTQC